MYSQMFVSNRPRFRPDPEERAGRASSASEMAGCARLEGCGRPPISGCPRLARNRVRKSALSRRVTAPLTLRDAAPESGAAPRREGPRAHTSRNLIALAQDLGKARLFRRRELRSVCAGGGRIAPLPARDKEQAEGADEQNGGGAEPQQRGMRGE